MRSTHFERRNNHTDDLFLDCALCNLREERNDIVLFVKPLGSGLLVRQLPDTGDGAVLLLRRGLLLEPFDDAEVSWVSHYPPRDALALLPHGDTELLLAQHGVEHLRCNVAGLESRTWGQLPHRNAPFNSAASDSRNVGISFAGKSLGSVLV